MNGARLCQPDTCLARGLVSHEHVRQVLSNVAWPCGSQSSAPAAKAASGIRPRLQLGMAINRASGPCMSRHTQSHRSLTKLLAKYVHQHLPDFPFASLAVAHSSESGIHQDPNVSETALVAVGWFTGGCLWIHSGKRHHHHARREERVLPLRREDASRHLQVQRRPALHSDCVQAYPVPRR